MPNDQADIVEYVRKMITADHVGGTCLVIQDVHDLNLSEVLDETYHSAIIFQEPTQEESAAIMRVLKPGAHVAMFSPPERPTGYVGACALEDAGFEIRDTLFVATDAADFYHVHKSNSKEREFGCEALRTDNVERSRMEVIPKSRKDDLVMASIQEAMPGLDLEGGVPLPSIPDAMREHFRPMTGFTQHGNDHPTVKPVGLITKLLEDVPKDAPVLDPFLGSGTTAVACVHTDHDLVGFEREEPYVKIAESRVKAWSRKLKKLPEPDEDFSW